MEPEKKKTVVPMAAPVEEPKPNMFQNWTQNGQGNWNKLNQEANAGAQQWATDTMQKANITDPTAPAQPATPPYNPGVQVAQPTQKQPVVQQQTKPYTGGPDNPEAAVDYLQAMYTSPQREEELRKASVQQQRIMAVANALRHIGNIYYTSKGATPQQFNNPVSEERTRYLKEKAIRDQNNYRYMTYQQAKAAQEQKAKQWEQQFKYNLAKDAANFELKKNESEARQQRQNALAELDRARLEGQIDKNTYQRLVNQYYPETAQARINEIESRIAKNGRTGGGRGGRSGGTGGKYSYYDENGNLVTVPNRTMYDQGVNAAAGRADIPTTEEYVTTNEYGDQTKRTRNRKTTEIGADLKNRANSGGGSSKTEKQKKKNPMGGSSSSTTGKDKKKNPMS